MKKLFCGILAVVLILGCLAGCGQGTSTTSKPDVSSSYSSISEVSSKEDDNIPDFVKNIYQKFYDLEQENNFGYKIINSPEPYGKDGFSFEINLDPDSIDFEVSFFGFEGVVRKSFDLQYLNDSVDVSNVRDYITAVFLSTDNSLTLDQAKEKMQSLINSYTGKDFSSVVESGEYLVFIEPFDSDSTIIRAKHKDEIFPNVDTSQYTDVHFSSYNAPELNKGINVCVKGSVIDHKRQHSGDGVLCVDYLTIKASDGNEYRLNYFFSSNPINFEIGKSYTFYGNIAVGSDDEPAIAIHYYE